MGIAPDSILGQAVSLVSSKISDLDAMADRYNSNLTTALANISSVRVADVPKPSIPAVPEVTPPVYALGAIPDFKLTQLTIPPALPGPDLGGLLDALDVDLDDLPLTPEPIALVFPAAPGRAEIPAPIRPDVDTVIDMPDAPAVAIPEMEALEQISLPEFTFPELPTFDEVPPDGNAIQVPEVFINWAEPVYASELLDELQAQAKAMLAGGTGLPPAIEEALFTRARERDSAETSRLVREAMDTWAGRDFSMPPGMAEKQVAVIREQGRLKAAELNRDILIEAAKWQIESIRFAVERGLALEQLTSNMHLNFVQRLFEVAKFQAESQINVFNARVALFNAQNGAFETLAQVYRAKLEGALSKLTAYKTAVEGQAAVGQINQQRVELFKAKLSAVESSVEIYKATMQGAQIRAETIKSQFDSYRADVQAYAEQVAAEKVNVDIYRAQVEAETARGNAMESQVRAYSATVQALANKADIKLKNAQSRLEAAKIRLSKFLAEVENNKATLQASLSNAQYATTSFTAQVDAWKAQASANIADAEMKSRFADMSTRTNIAYAEMQVSEYQANMQNAVQQAGIAMDGAKAVGQFTAQLAAGAMSAAHVSASVSGSGSASSSDSESTSTSTSYSYNY